MCGEYFSKGLLPREQALQGPATFTKPYLSSYREDCFLPQGRGRCVEVGREC